MYRDIVLGGGGGVKDGMRSSRRSELEGDNGWTVKKLKIKIIKKIKRISTIDREIISTLKKRLMVSSDLLYGSLYWYMILNKSIGPG